MTSKDINTAGFNYAKNVPKHTHKYHLAEYIGGKVISSDDKPVMQLPARCIWICYCGKTVNKIYFPEVSNNQTKVKADE